MKRKSSYLATEASFDTLMADETENQELRKEDLETLSVQSVEPVKKTQPAINRSELDRDSDYEGSDFDTKGDVTTLKMLFEKCQSTDIEFYDSCVLVGLLSPYNDKCVKCDTDSPLVEAQLTVDNLLRRCPNCNAEWSIRRDSWVEGINATLKDLTLTVYCWCRGYSHSLTTHEIEVDPNTVSLIFSKCSSVPEIYYQNQMSNIGGESRTILADIFTYNDRLVFGLFDQDAKNLFFEILKPDIDESRIVTILIDNLTSGSTIITGESSRLSKILDSECLLYLKESWDIDFKTESVSTNSLILHWAEFETQLPPANNLDPTYQNVNADSILRQALFRKRMENSKDCFLFFLAVISELFNSSFS